MAADRAFGAAFADWNAMIETIETLIVTIDLMGVAVFAVTGALVASRKQMDIVGFALIFVLRPLVGWFSLAGTLLQGRDRAVVAFYGVRGIGSVYYLAYAGHHVDLVNEYELWATVAFTIFLSTLVHGLTAGIAIERTTHEAPTAS